MSETEEEITLNRSNTKLFVTGFGQSESNKIVNPYFYFAFTFTFTMLFIQVQG